MLYFWLLRHMPQFFTYSLVFSVIKHKLLQINLHVVWSLIDGTVTSVCVTVLLAVEYSVVLPLGKLWQATKHKNHETEKEQNAINKHFIDCYIYIYIYILLILSTLPVAFVHCCLKCPGCKQLLHNLYIV